LIIVRTTKADHERPSFGRLKGKVTVFDPTGGSPMTGNEGRGLPRRPLDLPARHADPFDRQIIAQALVENIPVVTPDEAFNLYEGFRSSSNPMPRILVQMSTTLSVRLDSNTKIRLEALAKRARRSKSFSCRRGNRRLR
jgi:hypothetical protein